MKSGENLTVNIRSAKTGDIDLLLQWGRKMYKVEKQYMPLLKYSEIEARERYMSQIDNPLFCFLIAEFKDKPVGYLYAHLDRIDYLKTNQKECEVEVVYIDKEARGNKIASKLISRCIEWAKQNNAFGIRAGIFVENIPSRKTFESLGFSLMRVTYTKNLVD